MNLSQSIATIESIESDARHRIGNGYRGQATAVSESRTPDACHGVGDGNGGQAAATCESTVSYAHHGVGDFNGGQTATRESFISDTRYGVGDDRVITSSYQFIFCCMDNGITVVSGIKNLIIFIHGNGRKIRTTRECIVINARYRLADCYGGQTAAQAESIFFNACHRVANGYGGQAAAILDSAASYARHGVGDDN